METTFEEYKAQLISITAKETKRQAHEIKVNDAAVREWYDAGIPAYYCFRENYVAL